MTDLQELQDLFIRKGYAWTFTDGKRTPTPEELDGVILRAVDVLKDSDDSTQLEVGRLIVKKSGSFYDVYVHVLERIVE